MVAEERVRSLALDLPESEEHAHFGRPSFRTRKRIFATLPDQVTAVLKLPLDEQSAVVETAPEVFSLGGWSHQGWTRVALERIDEEALAGLLELAWRSIATQRAVREFDARSPGQG
jgi:hypothetical protein